MNVTRWTIQVWMYRDCPVEFRRLSNEGDWIALVPDTFAKASPPINISWLEGWKSHVQIGGWTVYVGPPRGE